MSQLPAPPAQEVLHALREARTRLEAFRKSRDEPIAIVGIGCRFPLADTPQQFWELLRDGVDATGDVPADRPEFEKYYDPDPDREGRTYTRRGGFLRQLPDRFDAHFFGISAREAEAMDPQQRLLLEVAWEALENAGIACEGLRRSATGVFVGISTDDYHRLTTSLREPETFTAYSGLGTARCVAAGRLSYVFGFQGPCIQLDTACSSSLVAVHLACQSLRSGESSLALAGGVNLVLSPMSPIWRCRLRALAPDGRCKTFDASADGYGQGEGCGIVALKRLSDAQADGDRILATIRGSAVNHDGPSSGLTAPNELAQEQVIRRALENAQVEPDSVSYVEAHGTGTALGDPIELNALGAVFGKRARPLLIGSVKSNIGHSEAAAGIACLIKTALAIHHRQIPRHLHFHKPNPYIAWDRLPVRVVTNLMPWPEGKRIAGVSSFGLSGTNAHVVLEEGPPAADPSVPERPRQLLCLSAKTPGALASLAGRYGTYLNQTEERLADICHTANAGRSHFAHRLAVVGASSGEIADRLAAAEMPAAAAPAVPLKVAFRPGAGADMVLDPLEADRLAELYRQGAAIDWHGFDAQRRRVVLPTYPFQRERYWSHALPPATPKSAVIDLLDRGDAASLGTLLGVDLSREQREILERLVALHRQAAPDGIYRIDWEPAEREYRKTRDMRAGAWMISGDLPGLAEGLGARGERTGANGTGALKGVLRILDATADPTEQAVALLALMHSLAGRPARVWLIGRGVQSSGGVGQALSPANGLSQAPAWGIGKVAALEHPDRWGGLIDLPANPSPGDVAWLVDEILDPNGETQVMRREGRRFVARLNRAVLPAGRPIEIRPDATYLITGGTGALGWQIARWLAGRGARRLTLTGRHGASLPALDELRRSGVEVRVAAADAANVDEMRALVAGLPDLRGVVHAAGIGGRQPIGELDAGALRAVLRPKVTGGWVLHEITRSMDLDFFVLFSSIASVWGSKTQAHYTAANQYLDTLAWHRRNLGLHATSVNWGPWAGTLAEDAVEWLRRSGVNPIQPALAFAALDAVLASGAAQVAVANIDWVKFKSVYEAKGPQPLLANLGPVPGPAQARETATGADRPPRSRGETLAMVRELVARVLGEGVTPDPSQGFADLGLDSLMAVELKKLLEDRFRQPLSATVIFNYPTVDKLTNYLMGLMGGARPAPTPAPSTAAAPTAPASIAPAPSTAPPTAPASSAAAPTAAAPTAAPPTARELMAMIAREAED
jgi:polyene macrolide polyketide synthase, A-type KR domains